METELIHAERLLYGEYRYKLTVRRKFWRIAWKAIFYAAGTLHPTWYNQDKFRVTNAALHDDLTYLLVRALATGQVPPQATAEAFYA